MKIGTLLLPVNTIHQSLLYDQRRRLRLHIIYDSLRLHVVLLLDC